jgi:hypothetical protein
MPDKADAEITHFMGTVDAETQATAVAKVVSRARLAEGREVTSALAFVLPSPNDRPPLWKSVRMLFQGAPKTPGAPS